MTLILRCTIQLAGMEDLEDPVLGRQCVTCWKEHQDLLDVETRPIIRFRQSGLIVRWVCQKHVPHGVSFL